MRRLESMYNDRVEWLSYVEIDKLVRRYKSPKTTQADKVKHRDQLLRAYHKYFLKYVALLKGLTSDLRGKDTILFLGLFNGYQGSNSSPMHIRNKITHKKLIRACYHLETEEIYNELVSIFLILLEKFSFRPKVSFAHYVTQYMRWDIKSWILKLTHEPTTYARHNKTTSYIQTCLEYEQEGMQTPYNITSDLQELNLAWVAKPTQSIFLSLSNYERFLIYLRFKEGLSLTQISKKLGHTKSTICTHYAKAIRKLQTIYHGGNQICEV